MGGLGRFFFSNDIFETDQVFCLLWDTMRRSVSESSTMGIRSFLIYFNTFLVCSLTSRPEISLLSELTAAIFYFRDSKTLGVIASIFAMVRKFFFCRRSYFSCSIYVLVFVNIAAGSCSTVGGSQSLMIFSYLASISTDFLESAAMIQIYYKQSYAFILRPWGFGVLGFWGFDSFPSDAL